MRIISGKFKGRRFNPPADKWPTRPTTDFAKEGLFNILQNFLDFEEIKVLELFGGTGNLSYEFISRGCRQVTFVDKYPGCVKFVEKTARELDFLPSIRIVQADAFKFIDRSVERYDFIFADPPFAMALTDTLPNLVFEKNMLLPGGCFVLEHDANNDFAQHPRFSQVRNYGGTFFSFFDMPEEQA